MRLIDTDKITSYTAYEHKNENQDKQCMRTDKINTLIPVSSLDKILTATFEYDKDTKFLLEDLKQCNSCIRISDLVRKLETIDKDNNHGIWTIKQILQFIIINNKIYL